MSNFALIVSTIFGGAWKLFQLPVPGFSFTYADVVLAVMFATIALALVRYFFNRDGVTSTGRSSRNPRISEERKNDTR